MFIGTATFFLGGRLIVHIIGYDAPLFREKHFGPIDLTAAEATQLISVTLGCFLAIHAGYFAFWAWRDGEAADGPPPQSSPFAKSLTLPAMTFVILAVPVGIIGMISQYQVVWGGEYVGLYKSDDEFATRLLPLTNYALLMAVGLAVASGNRWAELTSGATLGVFSLGYLGLGVRSAFLSFMLLAVWLFHKRVRRLSILAFVVLPVVLVVIAQSIWAFSARSGQTTEDISSKLIEFHKAIKLSELERFVYYQSVSLLSIAVADKTSDYPLPAYVQTFVPGFGVAATLTGHRISLPDLYFPIYMAKTSLPGNFSRGETMGWSIVSDMIVFSQRSTTLFVILSAIVGFGFAALIALAKHSALWFGALALIFPKLMMLPRAGLYSIFPYLEVFFVIVGGWYFLWKFGPVALSKMRISLAKAS